MTYRPYRFDFGMRYLHRDFPEHARNLIQELSYVSDVSQLADKIARAETAFEKAVSTFRDKKTLDSIFRV